jgi:FAD/FMN-containing dehydrogenase
MGRAAMTSTKQGEMAMGAVEAVTSAPPADAGLVAALSAIVGDDAVQTGEDARIFFSTDIWRRGPSARAVVRITSAEQLAEVVRCCTSLGLAVIPRGGGFSYTAGYVPTRENCVVVDMRGLDAIIEINEADMYVRVGTGCTWQRLYETLKARGLRTPYYGPMSGYRATVGGALSQGSFFLGSSEYGTTAESVLSLEVVLGDGSIIHTGSDGDGRDTGPFFRHYGPDLTGIFLGDTGALGFKTVATLKLIRFPEAQAYGSFSFANGADTVAALSEIGRAGLAAEAYAWDPYFVELMSQATTGTRQDLSFLWQVIRNGSGIVDGLAAGLRMALNGKRVFARDTHIVQVMIDSHSAAGAAARLKKVRAIALGHGGRELAPSIPRATRAQPFVDFNVPERRSELRNLPTNSIYPHSRAPAAMAAIRAFFDGEKDCMTRHGVTMGMVLFAVGRNAMCIEPLVYWNDAEHFLHDRIAERSDSKELATHAERPEATLYVLDMRERLKAVMRAHGAVHVQIGKAYDWLQTREPGLRGIIGAIKSAVDAKGLINPGSLGL